MIRSAIFRSCSLIGKSPSWPSRCSWSDSSVAIVCSIMALLSISSVLNPYISSEYSASLRLFSFSAVLSMRDSMKSSEISLESVSSSSAGFSSSS